METVYTYKSTKTSMFFQVIECRYKYLVRTVTTFWTEEWVNACRPCYLALQYIPNCGLYLLVGGVGRTSNDRQ